MPALWACFPNYKLDLLSHDCDGEEVVGPGAEHFRELPGLRPPVWWSWVELGALSRGLGSGGETEQPEKGPRKSVAKPLFG